MTKDTSEFACTIVITNLELGAEESSGSFR